MRSTPEGKKRKQDLVEKRLKSDANVMWSQ